MTREEVALLEQQIAAAIQKRRHVHVKDARTGGKHLVSAGFAPLVDSNIIDIPHMSLSPDGAASLAHALAHWCQWTRGEEEEPLPRPEPPDPED